MWDLPDPFTIEIVVQPEDIDDYDHTNNAVYLRWLDEVTWAHADAEGAGPSVHSEMRRGMVVHRTELQYIAPALLGDELLVANWLVHCDARLRAHRRFQIVRPKDGKTLLRALTQYVCIDLDSGRPARMPPLYRERYVVVPSVAEALGKESWPFALPPVLVSVSSAKE